MEPMNVFKAVAIPTFEEVTRTRLAARLQNGMTEKLVDISTVGSDIIAKDIKGLVPKSGARDKVSPPPGGFNNARFEGPDGVVRSIEAESNLFAIDAMMASIYLICTETADMDIDCMIRAVEMLCEGADAAVVKCTSSRVKRLVAYYVHMNHNPRVVYFHAKADLANKVFYKSLVQLFNDGYNSVFTNGSDKIVPECDAAVGVAESTVSQYVFEQKLVTEQDGFITNYIGHADLDALASLVARPTYEFEKNDQGTSYSDAPGVGCGLMFPFPAMGRTIMALDAVSELFGNDVCLLVHKDKRNPLFNPYALGGTTYNRVVPVGPDKFSMARCALSYSFNDAKAAYVSANSDFKAATADERVEYKFHDRFKYFLKFDENVALENENVMRVEGKLVDIIGDGISDAKAIGAAIKVNYIAISYLKDALQAQKSGVSCYIFLLDPGSKLCLVLPRSLMSKVVPSCRAKKSIDNTKLTKSVYMRTVTSKMISGLNSNLTYLALYAILTRKGVDCKVRLKKFFDSSSLNEVTRDIYHNMYKIACTSKLVGYYVNVPTYGAKKVVFLDNTPLGDEYEFDADVGGEFGDLPNYDDPDAYGDEFQFDSAGEAENDVSSEDVFGNDPGPGSVPVSGVDVEVVT
jgi:hypothetical protein